jgi:hypothetical protein
MSLRSVPKIAFCRYFGTMTMWYRNTTGHGFGFAMLALWFLLRVALAGPHREKSHSSSRINAGTAEPFRVSPPEAVAYPLELMAYTLINLRRFYAT